MHFAKREKKIKKIYMFRCCIMCLLLYCLNISGHLYVKMEKTNQFVSKFFCVFSFVGSFRCYYYYCVSVIADFLGGFRCYCRSQYRALWIGLQCEDEFFFLLLFFCNFLFPQTDNQKTTTSTLVIVKFWGSGEKKICCYQKFSNVENFLNNVP